MNYLEGVKLKDFFFKKKKAQSFNDLIDIWPNKFQI